MSLNQKKTNKKTKKTKKTTLSSSNLAPWCQPGPQARLRTVLRHTVTSFVPGGKEEKGKTKNKQKAKPHQWHWLN
jgi:hypothetical protein